MRVRLLIPALTLALAVAGCGAQPSGPTGGPGGGPSAEPAAGRGWIDGEPDWDAGSGGEESGTYDMASEAPLAGAPEMASGSDSGSTTLTDEPVGPGSTGPLRAGSVDDNADYEAYLAYLRRIDALDLRLRPFDARGRVLVTVTGSDGRPAAGEAVTVSSGGDEVARVRTTADGTARFLPAVYGEPVDGTFTFTAGDGSAEAAGGGTVELAVSRAGGYEGSVPLDVLFLLDATGSMGDEIDQLKKQIDSVSERVAGLDGAPDVRFAMTLYRDQGDEFVTSTFDFTGDIDAFRDALDDVRADGGGDYPEALEEGLAEALDTPSWRPEGEAVQLVFLVADAPPHTNRDLEVTYPDAVRDAVARGIKIFPVASSESDDRAEAVFRQIGQATGARFVFLSYGAAGAATGENTDIDSSDYEELSLDDLIVRLTAEELAALTGDDVVPDPDPSPTDEPTPPGQ